MNTRPFPFYFPADTPPMTFEALAARLRAVCDLDRCISCPAKIGSTIEVRWCSAVKSALMVRLYYTCIAVLWPDGEIRFPEDDPHRATTAWIERIVVDNGLGHRVGRIPRRKADGPGPSLPKGSGHAGLLCIDFDRGKPVHGRTWTADREQIARDQEHRERWAAEMAFRSLHPGEWDADLAAARPHQGMPDYRDRVDPRYWQGTRHQPDLSDIR